MYRVWPVRDNLWIFHITPDSFSLNARHPVGSEIERDRGIAFMRYHYQIAMYDEVEDESTSDPLAFWIAGGMDI